MTDVAPDILDTPEAGRRVLRGGALRVAGFVFGVLASVVSGALVTRHLGPPGYGRYQTVVALATIVQTVTDLGMTALGLREWSQRTGEDRDRFMRELLGLRLAMTVVGIGLATLAAVTLGYRPEMVAATAVLGVGVMVGVLGATVGVPLSAELRMVAVTGLDVSRQLLTSVLLVALVLVDTTNIVPYAAVVIPANAIVLVGSLWLLRGLVSMRPSFDTRAWRALIRPSISFALATAVGSLYVYAALVLMGLVSTPVQTGLFAASFRVFAIVAAVPGVLVTTAFPVLSRAARDDRVRLAYATQRLFEGTALLGGVALLTFVVGAEPIIDVIAGDKYAGAVPVLRIQGAAMALTFVIVTWGFTLMALHRHRAMIVVNGAGLVVSATTVLVLAHVHGAEGAAYGTLLGELTLAVGYAVALGRSDRAMRPQFARVARIVPGLVAALAVGLLCGLPAVAGTAVALAVYVVLALVLVALPEEISEHLPGPLRRLARG